MQRKQLVYLVGPITGCSYNGCTEWRDSVKKELEDTGAYHCLTPMRGKAHLHSHDDLPAAIPDHVRTPGCTDHDIISRDCYDCHRADVVFCNLLGAKIVSIGSMWELAWSYRNPQSYSVTIMEPGNVHWHCFPLQGSSIVLPTVEEGVEYMTSVLNV
jgi:hypothetical protein